MPIVQHKGILKNATEIIKFLTRNKSMIITAEFSAEMPKCEESMN
jgi:hypothetical protein